MAHSHSVPVFRARRTFGLPLVLDCLAASSVSADEQDCESRQRPETTPLQVRFLDLLVSTGSRSLWIESSTNRHLSWPAASIPHPIWATRGLRPNVRRSSRTRAILSFRPVNPIVDEISKASEHPLQELTRPNLAAADLPRVLRSHVDVVLGKRTRARSVTTSAQGHRSPRVWLAEWFAARKTPKAGCQNPAWSHASH